MKRVLFVIGGAIGLLMLLALAAHLLVDVNRYKPRLETAASNLLGMDVRVGRLGMGFFPRFHVTMEDGRILGERGVTVASAKKTNLWIELLPLLRREIRLTRIELTQPMLSIERDPGGRFNVERLNVAALLGAVNGGSLSLSHGTLVYADQGGGKSLEVTDYNVVVSRIWLARAGNPQALKGVSLEAKLACADIRMKNLSLSSLKASVEGKDGVFDVEPFTMRCFDGQAVGNLRADLSGPTPLYQVHCSLPGFRVEEFLKVLSPQRAVEGAMDFTASLSMQGRTGNQLVQTAAGKISMRGRHLTLVGNDLDGALSGFDSSQNFNLVDLGAVFLAGPVGLAVTRGYKFSGLFRGSGRNTNIETLVSDWRVERGVAEATDVALATPKNRIALKGGLDFVTEQFADVTVAAVDADGCARMRQRLRGPFAAPVVENPIALRSLAGPMLNLYRRTRRIFPTGPCNVFYAGSVAAPR
jgi:AsmA protein